ncbi:MAG: hypothetical protein PVG14_00370 [Anaerolineales bacterium]|jgi:hypothetical protein
MQKIAQRPSQTIFVGGIGRVPNRLPHDFEPKSVIHSLFGHSDAGASESYPSMGAMSHVKITYQNDNSQYTNRQVILVLRILRSNKLGGNTSRILYQRHIHNIFLAVPERYRAFQFKTKNG